MRVLTWMHACMQEEGEIERERFTHIRSENKNRKCACLELSELPCEVH